MKNLIFLLLTVFILSACQTHLPISLGTDSEGTPKNVPEKLNCQENIERIELEDIDYLLFANTMIDQMIQNRDVQIVTSKNRMRIYIAPVTHSNDEVDLTFLNTSIKNKIQRSGSFIIISTAGEAPFQLTGSFEEINQAHLCNETYEEFHLQLEDVASNKILWSDKKRFR